MTGKTLKELNVQVGDVVCYGGSYNYEVMLNCHLINIDSGVTIDYRCKWDAASGFTLISRAKKYTAWQFTAAPENAETHTMPDGSIEWRVEVKPVKTYHPLRIEHNGYVGYTTITAIDGKPQNVSIEWDALT